MTAILFGSVLGSGAVGVAEATAPAGVHVPADSKVIYGPDDRKDLYEITDPETRGLAASTCGLMNSSRVVNNGNGTYSISTSNYRIFGLPACPSEPFGNQPTAAYCSGFMVGPRLIATAGHCFDAGDIGNVVFVFGFTMANSTTPVTTVGESQVYFPTRVVGRRLSGDLDYAVVEVDRDITAPGAYSLPIRREGVVPLSQRVGVIGHPSGLPLKVAFGSTTRVYQNSNTGYFVANVDTYGGNSGSPVFNQDTGVVEGILVRGASDFNVQGNCFVSNQLADSSATEDCSKTTSFMQFIPEISTGPGDHTADQNGDNRIDMSELLRIVQLYNVSEFGCDANTEDGYSTTGTLKNCDPHSSDYNPQDWTISLPEVLRAVQFYNLGGYVTCQGSEDGFCLP
jgi:hypothetical protein